VKLGAQDAASYKATFSALLREGFRPEEYPVHFEKVKLAIAAGFTE
jgi:hypothetical protein